MLYESNAIFVAEFTQNLNARTKDALDEVVMGFAHRVKTTISTPDISNSEAGKMIYDSAILDMAKGSLPLSYRIFMRSHVTSLLAIFPEQMNAAIDGATRDIIDAKGLTEGDTGYFGEEDMAQLVPAMLWRLGNYPPQSGVALVKRGIEDFLRIFQGKRYVANGYELTTQGYTIFYSKTHKYSARELIDLAGVGRTGKNPS